VIAFEDCCTGQVVLVLRCHCGKWCLVSQLGKKGSLLRLIGSGEYDTESDAACNLAVVASTRKWRETDIFELSREALLRGGFLPPVEEMS
jgi:hypothetical protein